MAADEKRFDAGGRTWVARFDFNAICELEERSGTSFLEYVAPFMMKVEEGDKDDPAKLLQAARGIKFADLRAIFHQSLLAAQPDTSLASAGNLIEQVGLPKVMEIVAWAIVKAMPSQEGAAGDDGAAHPPKAA